MKKKFFSLSCLLFATGLFVSLAAGAANTKPMEAEAIAPTELPTVVYANMDDSAWPSWGAKYSTNETDGRAALRLFAWKTTGGDNNWDKGFPDAIVEIQGRKFAKWDLNKIFGGTNDTSILEGFLFHCFDNDNNTKTNDYTREAGKDTVFITGTDNEKTHTQESYYSEQYTFEELNLIGDDKTIKLYDVGDYYSGDNVKIHSWWGTGSDDSATWPGADMTKDNTSFHGHALYSYTHTYEKLFINAWCLFQKNADSYKTKDIRFNAARLVYVIKDWEKGEWYSKTDFDSGISFIYTTMKMEQYDGVKTTSECADNYNAAKTAYATLNYRVKSFIDYVKPETWTRLEWWAKANEENFDKDSGTFTPANLSIRPLLTPSTENQNLTPIVIFAAIVLVGGITVALVLRRRKED